MARSTVSNYKQLQAQLKQYKAQGITVQCKLNAKADVLAAEVKRIQQLNTAPAQELSNHTLNASLSPTEVKGTVSEVQVECGDRGAVTVTPQEHERFIELEREMFGDADLDRADVMYSNTFRELEYGANRVEKARKGLGVTAGYEYKPGYQGGSYIAPACNILTGQHTELTCDVCTGQSCNIPQPRPSHLTPAQVKQQAQLRSINNRSAFGNMSPRLQAMTQANLYKNSKARPVATREKVLEYVNTYTSQLGETERQAIKNGIQAANNIKSFAQGFVQGLSKSYRDEQRTIEKPKYNKAWLDG